MTAALAAVLLVLAGCSGGSDDSGSTGSTSSSGAGSADSSGDDSVLKQALSRIAPDGLGEPSERSLEFGATAELVELAGEDEVWKPLTAMGQAFMYNYMKDLETLGYDGEAADYAATAGTPPSTLYLVAGGQDSAAIEDGAKDLGYEDEDGVLTHDVDPTAPISVSVAQIKAQGSDVVLGSVDADLSLIEAEADDGDPGLLDDPQVASLAECLGDVPAAMASDAMDDGTLLGIGAQQTDGAVESVICVVVEDGGDPTSVEDEIIAALEDGTSLHGHPYSDLFTDPTSDVTDTTVKVTVKNGDDVKPMMIFQMLQAWDVPGVTKR